MACYRFRQERIREILDRKHLDITACAEILDMPRSYLSLLINGRRVLSARMRRRMLASEPFSGVPENELWVRDDEAIR